ncbi:MAG: hypothetical protein GWO39_12560, partial [Gammaproteobacteria bacterium]|nr:hypothetical protein [Gammaproteobacteria bacterium]NIT64570.1 hypothetical protein [Gammaproteobacteria bacterium]NIV21504.1 hypothetical protein [Gammaproteobacteria bacterium]NIY33150.1 hypothetical protein [Gammaproteobacteria bacterium]
DRHRSRTPRPPAGIVSTVWILGAGQLGAMLSHAGQPLAVDVRPVPLDAQRAPDTAPEDIVSPEI